MVTITVPEFGDTRFKSWAKVLQEVKPDAKNGFGFVGEFVEVGRKVDCDEGAVVLVYSERGSRARRVPWVKLYRVEHGQLVEHAEVLSEDWAFEIREKTRELLSQTPDVPQELRDAVAELVSKYGLSAVEQALREAK
jgi:hypothetical protein